MSGTRIDYYKTSEIENQLRSCYNVNKENLKRQFNTRQINKSRKNALNTHCY